MRALSEQGFCIVTDVVDTELAEECMHDAFSVQAGCGINGPMYMRNMSWQERAIELLDGLIDPARASSILEAPFYLRPNVINDTQRFARFLAEPRLGEIITEVVGARARVMLTTLFVHECGTPRGPWHATGPFNPDWLGACSPPFDNVPRHLTLQLLCTDFTDENGGVWAVPGSHLRPTNPGFISAGNRVATEPDEIRITARAGSVLVFDTRLWRAVAAHDGIFPRVSVEVELAPAADELPEALRGRKAAPISAGALKNLPASAARWFAAA